MLNTQRSHRGEADGTQAAGLFLARLREEAERALRYNHFFTIAGARPQRTSPEALYGRVRLHLRSTDIVGVVGDGDDTGGGGGRAAAGNGKWVAAILPETDREGAHATVQRLTAVLHNMLDVKICFAVYPDDSTDPEQLLRMADPEGG